MADTDNTHAPPNSQLKMLFQNMQHPYLHKWLIVICACFFALIVLNWSIEYEHEQEMFSVQECNGLVAIPFNEGTDVHYTSNEGIKVNDKVSIFGWGVESLAPGNIIRENGRYNQWLIVLDPYLMGKDKHNQPGTAVILGRTFFNLVSLDRSLAWSVAEDGYIRLTHYEPTGAMAKSLKDSRIRMRVLSKHGTGDGNSIQNGENVKFRFTNQNIGQNTDITPTSNGIVWNRYLNSEAKARYGNHEYGVSMIRVV